MSIARSFVFSLALFGCEEATLRAPVVTELPALAQRAPEEVVLDVSDDGDALVGRPLPVPENSDADRRLSLRWLTSRGPRAWRYHNAEALEAHFVPGSPAVLVLTTEHSLVRLDAPGASPTTLDRDVYGPLSVDPEGGAVAYTRGEPPELEVVRADLATGRTVNLAPGLFPSWCPALRDRGTEALVVASPEGTPALYRVREGRAPVRLELRPETPLPTGPSSPVFQGDALVYESDGALYALGMDGRVRASLAGMGLPLRVPGASTLLAHDARRRVRALAPRALGGAR